ncbi:MAG: F0F1 ATP synthase subunit B [Lacrimispora sp.]|uniref:F0F1 ATP synthase subunit B n=1 Tax=Lacrimispora sp. TaxID=2719234 RepID=UPI0039E27630
MLRLDMNLVWNIVNLIVLYLLLKHFLLKPVLAVMDKRQAMIEQNISNARASEGQAEALRKQYEEKLAASSEEGQKLVEDARAQAGKQYERILKEAQENSVRLMEDARKNAQADQERAMREAKAQIAGLVLAATARVVNQEVSAKTNQAIYDSFLAEAGDSYDAGSH